MLALSLKVGISWSFVILLTYLQPTVAQLSAKNEEEKQASSHLFSTQNSSHSRVVSFVLENTSILHNLTSMAERKHLLETELGPQKKPLTFVLFMGTIYIVIFFCGIIGNISTCFVVIFNNCMHTTTNYYLFSLAVSDVLSLLLGLPPELYSIVIEAYPWPFGETFCLVRTFIFETTTIASVLTILTFTFERWLHICKAIYAKKFSSGFSRALKIILFIWVLSGLLAAPYAFTTGIIYHLPNYPESKMCSTLGDAKTLMNTYIQYSVLLLFIMPMTLISIMYILIGITLWKSQTKHKCCNSTNNSAKSTHSASASNGNYRNLSRFFHRVQNNQNGQSTPLKPPQFKFVYPSQATPAISSDHDSGRKSINKNNAAEYLLVQTEMGNTTTNTNTNNNNNTNNNSNSNTSNRKMSEFSVANFSGFSTNGFITNANYHTAPDRASKEFEHISYRARQSRRDVVKMLFVVVLAFFTCWAPYHSQRFITTYYQPSSTFMMKLFEYIYYISGIAIYISSTINPILYNVMSKRYRTAFKNTLKMICSCQCSSKSNHAFTRSSKYYSSINFNAINTNNSRRRTQI